MGAVKNCEEYFFKNLSEREEIDFERLLDAREILQRIIYSHTNINEYLNKIFTDKEDAFKALYFLKKYAGIKASIKTHSTTKNYISLATIITYTIELD